MRKLTRLAAAFLAVLAAALVAAPAHAGPPAIDAAKTQGIVGEQVDGYLGLVSAQADPALRRQVQEVNAERRALYTRLAAETGTTVEQVAIVTGEKLIARAAVGEYVFDASGNWKRK